VPGKKSCAEWVDDGKAARAKGDLVNAIACFKEATRLDPYSAKAWGNKGFVLAQRGDLEEGAIAFARAIDCDETLKWKLSGPRSQVLVELGRGDEAITWLDQLLSENPRDPGVLTAMAQVQFGLGYLEPASGFVDRGLREAPESSLLWTLRGSITGSTQGPQASLEFLLRAIELDGTNIPALGNCGIALADLERYDESLECFDRIVALDPRDPVVWANRARTLIGLERHADAVESCDEALKLHPDKALAWIVKAAALVNLGEPEEALACCDKGIELDPTQANALLIRSAALRHLGRTDEADKDFATATAVHVDLLDGQDGNLVRVRFGPASDR